MNKELYYNNYPLIIQEVLKYIQKIKEDDSEVSLLDIISDFCLKNGLEVELVGDAISSDVYFKSFIERDCQVHKYMLKGNIKEMEKW